MKDFRKLDVSEVWTNGSDLVVLGSPPVAEDDVDDLNHNCDLMGCGACHVLIRGRVDLLGLKFEDLPKEPE
jgi:hypothetical protein